MELIKYPSIEEVDNSLKNGEPLLAMISFDGKKAIIGDLDASVEHHILLANVGIDSRDIDKYFRIVLDDSGADWTFVCPSNYKDIEDKTRRIAAFYKDGFSAISELLGEIGMLVGINIPKRYQRHLNYLK